MTERKRLKNCGCGTFINRTHVSPRPLLAFQVTKILDNLSDDQKAYMKMSKRKKEKLKEKEATATAAPAE